MSLYKVSTPVTGGKLRLGRDAWWIALLVFVGVCTALVWAAAALSGLLSHGRPAKVSWRDAASSLFSLLSDPGNPTASFARDAGVGSAWAFWSTLLILGVAFTVALRVAWGWWQKRRTEGTDGLATRQQLLEAMSEKQALARIPALRPSLAKAGAVDVHEVAVFCGTAQPSKIALWATLEESVLLVAPPRAGKTQNFILPSILSFPGTVLATSSKVDVLYSTAELRKDYGPVWALDATGLSGWPYQLAWPLTAGCEDYQVARKRAETLSKTTKTEEGTKNGGYFALNAQSLLTCWLHAAALAKKPPMSLLKWATRPENREAIQLLAQNGREDLAQELGSQHDAAPEERSATWRTASQSLVALYDRRVAEIFAPADGAGNFDIEKWLRTGGTVFLVGEDEEGSALAPLMAAFAQAVFDGAKKVAARMPNGRLDPPLAILGDEIANVAPLPQIPQLMSVSGSQNIFVVAVLQSLAQAQERWGELGVRKMFGASTVKILLGGISDENELKAYSALAGEFDEDTESVSDSESGTSVSVSVRRRSVLEPGDIRMLKAGEGLVVHRQTPATRVRFVRAFEGPMAAKIAAANKAALELVNRG